MNRLCLSILILFAGHNTSGQVSDSALLPVFSSEFTDLKYGEQCRGYYIWLRGPYIQVGNLKFGVMDVGMPPQNGNDAKIEWRLANDRPFAVVVPVCNWTKHKRRPSASFLGNLLAIEGIDGGRGYSMIDTAIDANAPGANELARRLADQSYMARRGKK